MKKFIYLFTLIFIFGCSKDTETQSLEDIDKDSAASKLEGIMTAA